MLANIILAGMEFIDRMEVINLGSIATTDILMISIEKYFPCLVDHKSQTNFSN